MLYQSIYGMTAEKHAGEFEREHADYNALNRVRALDDLLDSVYPLIETINSFMKGNEEQKQLYREYERFLGTLNSYKDLMEADYKDADRDYMNDKEYFDALDD